MNEGVTSSNFKIDATREKKDNRCAPEQALLQIFFKYLKAVFVRWSGIIALLSATLKTI